MQYNSNQHQKICISEWKWRRHFWSLLQQHNFFFTVWN